MGSLAIVGAICCSRYSDRRYGIHQHYVFNYWGWLTMQKHIINHLANTVMRLAVITALIGFAVGSVASYLFMR